MNAYQFMSDSPWTTFFLAYFAARALISITSRAYRMIMVSLRGWPPAHLDADGDWKPEPKGDK